MKYTEAFSLNIKIFGVPNFDAEQFYRFMNIIHLEGKLEGMKRIESSFKNLLDSKEVSLELYIIYEKLYALTGRMEPDHLWAALGGRLTKDKTYETKTSYKKKIP